MNDLKQFRLDIWTDEPSGREVCALRLNRQDGSTCPSCGRRGEIYEWQTEGPCADARHIRPRGLTSVWFVLERFELEALASGKVSALEDGYHKMNVWGDHITFYDFQPPAEGCGKVEVPFVQFELPRVFIKYLLRICKFVWAQSHKAYAESQERHEYWYANRLELDIPLPLLKRFTDRYGRGKGQVDCQFSDRLISQMEVRPELREQVERVISIAKNSTRSIYGKTVARISNDWDGYFFRVPGMHGGIVNHAKDPNDNSWSIHT